MTKRIIRTSEAPTSPSYSQAVVSNGLVFVAGQGPFDPKTGDVVSDTIEEQTAQSAQCRGDPQGCGQLARQGGERHVHPRGGERFPRLQCGVDALVSGRSRGKGAKLPIRPQGMKISIALIAEA